MAFKFKVQLHQNSPMAFKNELEIYTIKTKSLLIARQTILFNPAKIENLIIHHINCTMHPHIRIVNM